MTTAIRPADRGAGTFDSSVCKLVTRVRHARYYSPPSVRTELRRAVRTRTTVLYGSPVKAPCLRRWGLSGIQRGPYGLLHGQYGWKGGQVRRFTTRPDASQVQRLRRPLSRQPWRRQARSAAAPSAESDEWARLRSKHPKQPPSLPSRPPLLLPAHLPEPRLHPLLGAPRRRHVRTRLYGRRRHRLPHRHRRLNLTRLRDHPYNRRLHHRCRHRGQVLPDGMSRRRHKHRLEPHPPLRPGFQRHPRPLVPARLPCHQPTSKDRRRQQRRKQHNGPPAHLSTSPRIHGADGTHRTPAGR